MNQELLEEILQFMNEAELKYANPQQKEDFVVRSILKLHPKMKWDDITDL